MNAIYPDLKGKSVFVTGGGSGIGAALTSAFLEQGARVAFVQRSDATDFCDQQETLHGIRPLFLQCDVTDTAALTRAIAQAKEAHGAVEILVNNAANDDRHDTLDVTEAYWDDMIAINLKCYFFAAQAVLGDMVLAGTGSIINFSSASYRMGMAGFPIYASSNAAISAMSMSLAREFGPNGIRVNALVPGWVLTDKQKQLWVTPESLEAHVARQCLKSTIAPEDIAGGVLFLASESARMMTGQTLIIDAGVI